MKSRVYCKNCKFDPGEQHGVWGCNLKFLRHIFGLEQFQYGYIKNQMKDCADYKRKWWRFWVKG